MIILQLFIQGWTWTANEIANIAWGLVDEWWCPSWLASAMASVSNFIADMTIDLVNLYSWVEGVMDTIAQFLTWDNIVAGFQWLIDQVSDIWDWFVDWGYNVLSIITNWWVIASGVVQDWIDTAIQGLDWLVNAWTDFWNNLWPALVTAFNILDTAWDHFIHTTLPNLVDFSWLAAWWVDRLTDINGLINAAFAIWQDLFDWWGDFGGEVIDFFLDPLEWLWQRFTDWFLGPEV